MMAAHGDEIGAGGARRTTATPNRECPEPETAKRRDRDRRRLALAAHEERCTLGVQHDGGPGGHASIARRDCRPVADRVEGRAGATTAIAHRQRRAVRASCAISGPSSEMP
jgi:hypothetical protein